MKTIIITMAFVILAGYAPAMTSALASGSYKSELQKPGPPHAPSKVQPLPKPKEPAKLKGPSKPKDPPKPKAPKPMKKPKGPPKPW